MSDDNEDDFALEDSSSADEYNAPAKKPIPRQTTPNVAKATTTPKTTKRAGLSFAPNGAFETPKDPPPKPPAGTKKKAVEDIYKRKTQIEHILLRPDTYIGSVEATATPMWVMKEEKMVHRTVQFVPGLYKIFDEILVNAADNKVRDPDMDTIKVNISKADNTISIMNNGKGVPVSMHADEGVYVPELIFGHLLTSSNYDDDEKKVVGGRNGYGAKLCNIFSTEFVVETSDKESGHKFKQVFNDNMSKKTKPKLTVAAKQDFTKITFKPDLAKFGMTELDDDIVAVMTKRVYDMAGVVQNVKVYLNDQRLKIKNFKEYVKLYLDSVFGDRLNKPTLLYDTPHPRWEVCFAVSDGQFQQVSFVNSICTSKGGTHVNMLADQIVVKTNEIVKKKNKGEAVKPHQIKNHIWLFVNCQIENPTFDSQTKENMTLKATKFGSKCVLSDDFMKKVSKSGIVDNIMAFALMKQANELKKKDGTKTTRLSGIAKLDDANNAGSRQHAQKCTLILTEGDSAKALAISGLSVVGRDNFGVFPLRGKLLNVREATHKQIMENAEINAIKQILGLKSDITYTSTEKLRYGHVMIMTDQDHDGSHIKGLVINLFDHFWPSLLKNPGFLLQFITPIVKVTKGTSEINFYNIPEYESWKEAHNDGKGWVIKYYKGLGTSTAADAKKYFSRMDNHLKPFARVQDEDRQHIDLAFSKKKADDRKDWLSNLVDGTFIDHTVGEIKITDFVNRELILFSMADNVRSIPSIVDGFKPGQRKILFSCIKRNLVKNEIKVAQLAGYVSEHSAYHHGEASLQSTIVGLAQNYVGSNNINVLEPLGQFGTRLQGGKDHAHARYIFTKLPPITRMLYSPADDKLLRYLNEENMSIEPEWYIPILPMVLVNGADGIGTGWSTSLPNYNPRDIVNNLRRRLDGEEFVDMHPWYRGFKGTIEQLGDKYKISGTLKKIGETTLEITELPLGSWTQTYKEFLEGFLAGTDKIQPSIKDYREYHTDTAVHFVIELTPEQMAKAEEEGLEKKFKMSNSKSVTNMVLFDHQGRLKKYESIKEIMEEFYALRLDFYERRKNYLAEKIRREARKIENQARFVLEVISGDIIVHNRKRADVIQQLKTRNYAPITRQKDEDIRDAAADAEADGDEGEEVEKNGYDYLLSMPIWNLTMEKVEKITIDRENKKLELEELLATPSKDLWQRDLDVFMEEWDRFEIAIEETTKKNATTKGKKGKAVNVDAARLKKRKLLFSKSEAAALDEMEDNENDDDYVENKGRKTDEVATPHTRPVRSTATSEKKVASAKQAPLTFAALTKPTKAIDLNHSATSEHSVKLVDGCASVVTDPAAALKSVKREQPKSKTVPAGTPVKRSATSVPTDRKATVDPFTFDEPKGRDPSIVRSPSVPGKQRRITDLFSGMRALATKRVLDMTVDLENDEEASSDSGSSKKRKTAADRVLDVDNTSKSQTKKAKFNSAMKPTGSPAVPPSTLVQPTSQDKKKVARKATRRERAAISDSDFDEEEQDVPLTKTTARSKGFVAEKDTEVTHPPARPRRSAANRKSVIDLAGDDDDDEERVKSPPPRPSPRKQRMDDEAAARIVISDLGLDDDEEDAENTPPPVRQSKPQSTKRAPRRAVAMDTDDSDASSSRMTSKSVYRIQDSEDEYVP